VREVRPDQDHAVATRTRRQNNVRCNLLLTSSSPQLFLCLLRMITRSSRTFHGRSLICNSPTGYATLAVWRMRGRTNTAKGSATNAREGAQRQQRPNGARRRIGTKPKRRKKFRKLEITNHHLLKTKNDCILINCKLKGCDHRP
jgi:hypothetical protein